jgi:hypothetical protein
MFRILLPTEFKSVLLVERPRLLGEGCGRWEVTIETIITLGTIGGPSLVMWAQTVTKVRTSDSHMLDSL